MSWWLMGRIGKGGCAPEPFMKCSRLPSSSTEHLGQPPKTHDVAGGCGMESAGHRKSRSIFWRT